MNEKDLLFNFLKRIHQRSKSKNLISKFKSKRSKNLKNQNLRYLKMMIKNILIENHQVVLILSQFFLKSLSIILLCLIEEKAILTMNNLMRKNLKKVYL